MIKHFLSVAIILLSFSIIYCGFQIGNYNKKQNSKSIVTNTSMDKGLLTFGETAKYLSMSAEQLKLIVNAQDEQRGQLSSFETYEFLPYIIVSGEKYFNKVLVNEWIKYNSTKWEEIN
ncbi:hypothetical protein [Neobacillus terrae]|uniref:hypothetical protein n=1 Tax=Neobacillus terrae TaxID=3034837 RepID=UPI00140E78D3|nr:hypothetical protein [Neobacillus terrae]NHM33640.1 hypothetical protein [Neobacillus terrae]